MKIDFTETSDDVFWDMETRPVIHFVLLGTIENVKFKQGSAPVLVVAPVNDENEVEGILFVICKTAMLKWYELLEQGKIYSIACTGKVTSSQGRDYYTFRRGEISDKSFYDADNAVWHDIKEQLKVLPVKELVSNILPNIEPAQLNLLTL